MIIFIVKKHLRWIIPFLSLLSLVCIIYFPVYEFQFLQWDDDYNIYTNPYLPGWDLLPIWKEPYMGLYIPLVYSVWSVIFHLTQTPDPMVFHIFNVILHLANSILVFLLIRKIITRMIEDMEENYWVPLVGAVLFAIHPLQIGAVAWASGGRDLMSAFFALSCVLFYFDRKNKKDYIISFVFFALALLCKPGIVSLPIVFVLFDYLLKEKIWASAPFFVLGLVFVPLTRFSQSTYMVGMTHQEWFYRPIIALDAIGFYISKFLVPLNLAVDYGRLPGRVINNSLFWPYLILAVMAIFLAYKFLYKKSVSKIALCLSFVTLLPVLGLVPFNFQRISTVTDHYMYLPMVGLALLFSFLATKINLWKFYIPLGFFYVFLVIAAMTRVPAWSDHLTFFNDMKAKNPMSHSSYIMLGDYYFKSNQIPLAEENFQGALIADPNSGVAAGNVAFALAHTKKYDQVLSQMRPYIDNPDFDAINAVHPHTIAMVYLSYATALSSKGLLLESFNRFCQVLKYKPRPGDMQEAMSSMQILAKQIKQAQPETVLQCKP